MRTTTRNREIRFQAQTDGNCVRPFRFLIEGGSPPYFYQFCQSPGGFVPTLVSETATIATFGNSPAGTYTLKLTDQCGVQEITFNHTEANSSVIGLIRPGCSDGLGSISLNSNAGFKTANFVGAPATFTDPLPFDLIGCITASNSSRIHIHDLPAGTYDVEVIDNCCDTIMRSFDIIGLEQEIEFDLNIRCQSFDFFFNHTSNNAISQLNYFLERLDPVTGNYVRVDSDVDNGQINGSFFDEGCYRIFRRYRGWLKDDESDVCGETLQEFCVDYGITFDSANAFQCDDGTVDVFLLASGPHPIEYCISQIDGVPPVSYTHLTLPTKA